MTVVLARAERPLVSVLLVTYGGWEWARKALEAVRDHTTLPYEVVVVDNASPDGTGRRLGTEVAGATVVLNSRNVGFGPAVNQAAALARGGYLALLNSDALVRPGWVEPLIAALESDPGAGAAVARLVNLDGSVQEAGSVLWSDGSTLAVGAGAGADDPAYRFRRLTDYGSAACMVLRRSDFLAVGGFDPAYLPAYCEDVDLALTLGHRGLHMVYEPRAEAVHVRFASTDERRAARLIEANRTILRRRWERELRSRVPPPDADHPHRLIAGRDAPTPDRVLVVGEAPPRGLLLHLAAAYPAGRITSLSIADPLEGAVVDELVAAGVEVAGTEGDLAAWFDARLFHVSAAVVLGPAAFAAVGAELARTQPHAPLIYDLGTPPGTGRSGDLRHGDVDGVRAADVVLCRTDAQERFAAEVSTGTRVRRTTEAGVAVSVVDELEAVGVVAEVEPQAAP